MMKIVYGLLSFLVVIPIWYYLLYQIMVRVEASELMWFLFYVYVPVSIIAASLSRIVEASK